MKDVTSPPPELDTQQPPVQVLVNDRPPEKPNQKSRLGTNDVVRAPSTEAMPPPPPPQSLQLPSQPLSPASTATPSIVNVQNTSTSEEEDLFDYQATVNALTIQFLSEFEETRVAALKWLIMLHQKAPKKVSLKGSAQWLHLTSPLDSSYGRRHIPSSAQDSLR
jgi:hypothetical protein